MKISVVAQLSVCMLPVLARLSSASPTSSRKETGVPSIVFSISPPLEGWQDTIEVELDWERGPLDEGVREKWTGVERLSLDGITIEEASFTGGPADADEVTCSFDLFTPSAHGRVNVLGYLYSADTRRFNVVETKPFVAGEVVKVKGAAILSCEAIYYDE